MSQVRRTLALSALDTYLGLALQIVSTLVIARILTPTQTGIFAVAAVFASLASTFRDFGVAEYLIQEKQLTDDTIRAALAVNIAASWLMAVLLVALAPLAARFYREDGVGSVMRVQAMNFVLIPFGAVTMAWFRRQMDFRPIVIANVAGSLTSFVVAITLVTGGHGYMSLAWSSLAGVAMVVLCATLQRPADLPRWPALRGVGRVLNFGRFASAIYIVGQVGKGAPEMVIGRALNFDAVGVFSRAAGLVEVFQRLVLRATTPVLMPYFAREVREQGSPRQTMLRSMVYLTGVGWPFLLCMGLGAFAAIRLMYGDQWLAAVPLARWLCAAAAVELLYSPVKEAMLAMGHPRESSRLQFGLQGLRLLGLAAVVPFGLPGACIGLLLAALAGAVLSHVLFARLADWHWRDVGQAVWRSAVASLAAAAPLLAWLAAGQTIDEGNYLLVGLGAPLLCIGGWLLALRGTGHPLYDEVLRLRERAAGLLRRAD